MYEFLNELSRGKVVLKTLYNWYNWTVFRLYEFLNELSGG
jgi:hypothetical protein